MSFVGKLDGDRILILGGSGAMGSAIAAQAASAGAEALIVGRNETKLAAVAARIGAGTRWIAGDAVNEEGAAELLKRAGALSHIVIALSSGGSSASSIASTEPGDFRASFSRLWANYNVLHLAPRFIGRGGSVTLISGSSARRPGIGFGVWTTLHGSLEALARAAALELAPIRVNVVSPGGIGLPPDRQLVEHAGAPEDIAAAVLALILNPAITGAVLDVDGGERLGGWSGGQSTT